MLAVDNNLHVSEDNFKNTLWEYFVFHANQRLQLLNFYIILETFIVTSLITIFQFNNTIIFRILLSFALVFFSFVFYALDLRTSNMIKNVEKSMMIIEEQYRDKYNSGYMIFSIEYQNTSAQRKKSRFARFFMSSSRLFHYIYGFFVIIGIIGFVLTAYSVF